MSSLVILACVISCLLGVLGTLAVTKVFDKDKKEKEAHERKEWEKMQDHHYE